MLKIISLFFLYLPFQFALNASADVDLASIRLFSIFIFLLWIFQGLRNKKINIRHSPITLLVFSFLFLSIFSLFFSENISWGARKLIFLLSFIPLYFVFSDLFSKWKLNIKTLLEYLIWGAFLSSLIGLIQFTLQFIFGIEKAYSLWTKIVIPFLGHSFSDAVLKNPSWLVNIGGHTLVRATSLFPDPHIFSFYLGMTAPIILSMLFISKKKIFFGVILFFVLLVDFLTFSRGGYLGILSGLLFFSIFFSNKKKLSSISNESNSNYYKTTPIKNFLLINLIVLIFITLFIIPNPINKRLLSIFNLKEGSNAGRIKIWEESLPIIANNPFFGVGLGNYPLAIKPSANYREPIYAHNTYLDIASETGILNALFWILIIFISLANYVKKYKKDDEIIYLGLSSGLVVFAIHSFFETAIFSVHILPLFIFLISF